MKVLILRLYPSYVLNFIDSKSSIIYSGLIDFFSRDETSYN